MIMHFHRFVCVCVRACVQCTCTESYVCSHALTTSLNRSAREWSAPVYVYTLHLHTWVQKVTLGGREGEEGAVELGMHLQGTF